MPTKADRPAGKSITIRIATLNVNGIRGRSNDIGEMLARIKKLT